jgi:CheY-like chemotaxis protein
MTASRQPHLLVVDDEPEIRTTLAEFLGSAGYAVETAGTVEEACEKLPGDFDLILSDIRFPDQDGFQLLKEAREANPELAVFLLTGYPSVDTIMEAKRWGAKAYFQKPLQLEQLEAKLRAHLGARHLLDAPLLLVGSRVSELLQGTLDHFATQFCAGDLETILESLAEIQPAAVLIEAGVDAAVPLLRHCATLPNAPAVLLVTAPDRTAGLADLMFEEGAAGVLKTGSPRAEVESGITRVVTERTKQQAKHREAAEAFSNKCESARPYRNGYYCQLPQDFCNLPRGGWIAINGREVQKCPRRPLLFPSLDEVGFVGWTGRVDASQTPAMRKELLALIQQKMRHIVIDAQGLEAAHYNLVEILGDLQAEFRKALPDGTIHVINLQEAVLEEFAKTPVINVRFSGPRIVDETAPFARWGTRFE